MRLKNFSLALVLASIAVLGGVGCGGGDSALTGLNNFRGNWTGTHRFFPQNGGPFQDSGLMNLTISSTGAVEGTMTKSSTNETVSVFGNITNRGSFNLTWTFAGFSSARTIEGPAVILNSEFRPDDANSRMTATNNNGTIGQLEFRLVRN